jgi:hypothetical protein
METLNRFFQWLELKTSKFSLLHAFLISLFIAFASILNHHGGILHPEMEVRLPYYLSNAPLLNKLFDSNVVESGLYRARELSYIFDFIDCQFVGISVRLGFPHFLSLTHYLLSIAIGLLVWLLCVRELNLKPLIGLGWLVLFWTSPSIFLGGDLFRTAKIWVAFFAAILFYLLYKIILVVKTSRSAEIPKKIWLLYGIAIFTIVYFDEQGLFLTFSLLIFMTIWGFAFRNKQIFILILLDMASLGVYELYKYIIAPRLTFMLSGYWPNFSYQKFLDQEFFLNILIYLRSGLFLYIETFRFLIGNPPAGVGAGLLLFFISLPIFYLYSRQGLSANYKKLFSLVFIELLIVNLFLIIIMNAFMVLRHPPLMWPDVSRVYYWIPTTVMLVMTLALLTSVLHKLSIPKWLIPLAMCFAIMGNSLALPEHKTILIQGHLQPYYQSSPDLLNSLENYPSMDGIKDAAVKDNPVFQFFKSN